MVCGGVRHCWHQVVQCHIMQVRSAEAPESILSQKGRHPESCLFQQVCTGILKFKSVFLYGFNKTIVAVAGGS